MRIDAASTLSSIIKQNRGYHRGGLGHSARTSDAAPDKGDTSGTGRAGGDGSMGSLYAKAEEDRSNKNQTTK